MRFDKHVESSLEAIQDENPGILENYPGMVEKIVREVHLWMDSFYAAGIRSMAHRTYLHHEEGIASAKKTFTENYGEMWGNLAEQEARRHVLDDCGKIPRRRDYCKSPFRVPD
jgi:hypothetical protein